MIDSERSIYPLDSNKKKEKKHAKRISLKTNKQVKQKCIKTYLLKKKSEYTTIMIKKYILQYIAQASFCDGFHSYF